MINTPAAAGPAYALGHAEQGGRRRAAEADQDVGIDKFDLAFDERQADLAFLRRRRAVAGWTPWDDIGDVGGRAIESDRRHHAIEQLARAPDERQPRDILFAAGGFADEHNPGTRIAVGEYKPLRRETQRAALEPLEHVAQRIEACGAGGSMARRHDGGIRGGWCATTAHYPAC